MFTNLISSLNILLVNGFWNCSSTSAVINSTNTMKLNRNLWLFCLLIFVNAWPIRRINNYFTVFWFSSLYHHTTMNFTTFKPAFSTFYSPLHHETTTICHLHQHVITILHHYVQSATLPHSQYDFLLKPHSMP